MATKNIYLGIAGEMVSGKTTASEFFNLKYGGEYLRFSKVIDKVLDILDLEHTRVNQQDMGTLLRENYGDDILARALVNSANQISAVKSTDKNFFILDGLRSAKEVEYLKQQPNSFFLYVETPIEVRYQRMQARQEKVGEAAQTFEEFKKVHQHAADNDVIALKELADFKIENNGSVEDYHAKLKEIGDQICL